MQTYGQRLLQAVGDTVLSMISLIIGAVVNIILDPIMIFGLLGCISADVPRKIDEAHCLHCGNCLRICPVKAVEKLSV